MNAPAASSQPNAAFALGALTSLVALIALSLLWELWLAPLRPGTWALALKALPLACALPGVVRRSVYTLQWASMLILLYLAEGVSCAGSRCATIRIAQLARSAPRACILRLRAGVRRAVQASGAPGRTCEKS